MNRNVLRKKKLNLSLISNAFVFLPQSTFQPHSAKRTENICLCNSKPPSLKEDLLTPGKYKRMHACLSGHQDGMSRCPCRVTELGGSSAARWLHRMSAVIQSGLTLLPEP